ncbi:MAG: polysaccharide deacetylase family protein [Anaerolineae bacterium]|jgi:peptidoglycan/xylan/chitin deacetylase (PgdA/CDA1 family)
MAPRDDLPRPLRLAYFGLLRLLPDPVVMSGPNSERAVALTFDDGPHRPYTDEILSILADRAVPATFFLLGRNVAAHPDVVRKIAAAGHVVGTHTYSHPVGVRWGPVRFAREIVRTHRLIARATGQAPKLFRPPRGHYDPLFFAGLRITMGYTVVLWSLAAKDWRGDSAAQITTRVVAGAGPGTIVCLHDGAGDAGEGASEDRSQTVAALPLIIDRLTEEGYRFVTVTAMLELDGERGTDA